MSVIFSDFFLSNEISGYTENKSTAIFFVHALFLSYKPVKVYRIDMDHPVILIVSNLRVIFRLDKSYIAMVRLSLITII